MERTRDQETLILPHNGQVAISDVLATLKAVTGLLAPNDLLELRVVALPGAQPDDWAIFAGDICPVAPSASGADLQIVAAGPLRLVRCRAPFSSVCDIGAFERFVRKWYGAITSKADDTEMQSTTSIDRYFSGSVAGPYPAWQVPVYAHSTRGLGGTPQIPRGPFFNQKAQVFAASILEVAELWLGSRRVDIPNSPQLHLRFTIPDKRAYFGSLRNGRDAIDIELCGNLPLNQLSVACLFGDAAGKESRSLIEPASQTPSFSRPPGDLVKLQFFLLSQEGECLDAFYEDEYRCTRTRRVLAVGSAPHEEGYLEAALAEGEGETLEFKRAMPLERQAAKSKELLKVACAFANSRGGKLFIGVSDDLEVVGLERDLIRLGQSKKDDAMVHYAKEIRRLVHEGLTPTIEARTTWLCLAGHDVLQVSIERSMGGPCALVESNEIFVRRGASCTLARPADLELMFDRARGSSSPTQHWR